MVSKTTIKSIQNTKPKSEYDQFIAKIKSSSARDKPHISPRLPPPDKIQMTTTQLSTKDMISPPPPPPPPPLDYLAIKHLKHRQKIPRILYQSWHTKLLPPKMHESVELLRQTNPEFQYILHDDNDSRAFIEANFEPEVVRAFDALVPGAYKSDLWRYCVLYKTGGVYLDIKYIPLDGFKLMELMDKEHFVLDGNRTDIYNAFMVSFPGNTMMREAINTIVKNVNTQYYGENSLDITGPRMLRGIYAKYYSYEHTELLYDTYAWLKTGQRKDVIHTRTRDLFASYPDYREEQAEFQNKKHYSVLWNECAIYCCSGAVDETESDNTENEINECDIENSYTENETNDNDNVSENDLYNDSDNETNNDDIENNEGEDENDTIEISSSPRTPLPTRPKVASPIIKLIPAEFR